MTQGWVVRVLDTHDVEVLSLKSEWSMLDRAEEHARDVAADNPGFLAFVVEDDPQLASVVEAYEYLGLLRELFAGS